MPRPKAVIRAVQPHLSLSARAFKCFQHLRLVTAAGGSQPWTCAHGMTPCGSATSCSCRCCPGTSVLSEKAWQEGLEEERCFAAARLGRQLVGLPAESFHACLLSMVLHHWPQEVQRQALDTAPCPKRMAKHSGEFRNCIGSRGSKSLHGWHRRLLKLRSTGCLSVRASC